MQQSDFESLSNSIEEEIIENIGDLTDVFYCFLVHESHKTEQALYESLRSKLKSFCMGLFMETSQRAGSLEGHCKAPPIIKALARLALGIPESQTENERIFSMSGRLSYPLRNKLGTEMINHLISVAQTFPTVYKKGQSLILTVKDFSPCVISLELHEDSTSREAAEESEGDCDTNNVTNEEDFVPDSQQKTVRRQKVG